MKSLIILCAVVAAVWARPDGETYNPAYDNFNAQELVENVRLLKNYAKCFLDQGPCTAEASDIKRILPEALQTSCGKCTPKQRELTRTVIRAFQQKVPDLWKQLIKKNDPNGEYLEAFNAFLNASD